MNIKCAIKYITEKPNNGRSKYLKRPRKWGKFWKNRRK